ncbi:glycosyltransferase [Candidatus Woesearchaeota archaeon]|nr:glycosyltransferase [Candidatus Woesearchaeota archaeon]
MITPPQDVTLTMIVRDELMNPAGGLHAVLARHLPFFEHAVVLDTGSCDGTRQLLEQMAGDYPQLRVFDATFEGYGPARNTANDHVETKYTFMLDADERVKIPLSFIEEIENFSGDYLAFRMLGVSPSSGIGEESFSWNPRLAHHSKIKFKEIVYELARDSSGFHYIHGEMTASCPLLHFLPERRILKTNDWYGSFDRWSLEIPQQSPAWVLSFPVWKTPNPNVLLNYGVDVAEEMRYLAALGLRLHPGIAERLAQTAPAL